VPEFLKKPIFKQTDLKKILSQALIVIKKISESVVVRLGVGPAFAP
jgi:hypothetical protein